MSNQSSNVAREAGDLMFSQKIIEGGITYQVTDRVYSNKGNPPLIDLLGKGCNRLLDIGCGAGDNAILVKAQHPVFQVYGIAHSPSEAEISRQIWETVRIQSKATVEVRNND